MVKLKFKLKPNINKVVNIVAIIIFVLSFIMVMLQNVELNKLNSTIATQEITINKLTKDNESLSNHIMHLNENITQLENENIGLTEYNESLELQIQEGIEKINELNEKIKQNNANSSSSKRDFKSYLPYQAITNKNSKQWELQQQATTNEDGIRCIDGIPMVAVGTGWGLWVGDIALVTCENGNSFKVIVGDIKADRHTDSENKTTVSNGCRCEFIVDKDRLDPNVRIMGNVATLDKYKGYVVNIEKIG